MADKAPSYEDVALQHGELPSRPAKPIPRGPFPLDIPVLNILRKKRVILASASPSRKRILYSIFPHMEILPSTKPENLSKEELGPFEYVLQTATMKCLDVYETTLANSIASIPDPACVIAADTIAVTTSGKILEKPRSEKEHIAMLKMLRNQKVHKSFTAVVVLAPREDAKAPGYNSESTVEETRVYFADVEDGFIEAYVRTREGVDKAGGYGLQGLGSLLVEKIEGQADNVMGLPLRATLGLVERAVMNQDDGEEDEDEDEEEDEDKE